MKRVITVLLLTIMIFNMTACSLQKEPERYQAQFLELFDTVTTILGYAQSEKEFSEFAQSVHDHLQDYHELYNIYNDYEGINNIKTINDNAGIAPVKVDQRIIDLLKFGLETYTLSEERVNIAYGAVLSVWHTYREEGINDPDKAALPPMDLLREKEKHTDINQVIIDEQASTVYLADSEMRLDVGAIAKGYATERVAGEIEAEGYHNALLSVGGNVRAIGSRGPGFREKADSPADTGEDWAVGIQNPDLESDEPYLDILELSGLSLVSSGDYERYYMVDGKRYHHIIDPVTLMPATYFRAVSVVTKDSGLADALSTTIFNLPQEEGLKLIESLPGTEALWVYADGTMRYSSGFEALLKKDGK